jgi:hypothetical protein
MTIYIPEWFDHLMHIALAMVVAVSIPYCTGFGVSDWQWWAIYLTSCIHSDYYGRYCERKQRNLIAEAIHHDDPKTPAMQKLSAMVRRINKNEVSKNEAGN